MNTFVVWCKAFCTQVYVTCIASCGRGSRFTPHLPALLAATTASFAEEMDIVVDVLVCGQHLLPWLTVLSYQLLGQLHPEGEEGAGFGLPTLGSHLVEETLLHQNEAVTNGDIHQEPKQVNATTSYSSCMWGTHS